MRWLNDIYKIIERTVFREFSFLGTFTSPPWGAPIRGGSSWATMGNGSVWLYPSFLLKSTNIDPAICPYTTDGCYICIYMCVCIYIYHGGMLYVYICVCMYIYIHIHVMQYAWIFINWCFFFLMFNFPYKIIQKRFKTSTAQLYVLLVL